MSTNTVGFSSFILMDIHYKIYKFTVFTFACLQCLGANVLRNLHSCFNGILGNINTFLTNRLYSFCNVLRNINTFFSDFLSNLHCFGNGSLSYISCRLANLDIRMICIIRVLLYVMRQLINIYIKNISIH